MTEAWFMLFLLAILSTCTVLGLTEEWFISLLLYCLPSLFKVWQRSGSCCSCYIVYHYCLRFDRREGHAVVAIFSTIMSKVWQRSSSCCCWNNVYHYCLMFDRGKVHFVATLFTIPVYGFREEWFMLLLLCLPLIFTFWQRSGSCRFGWL